MSRILIVDDDDSFRKMLVLTVQKFGHHVIAAVNSKEALKLHAAEPFDLVITDLIMPDKEGLETIMELRRKEPGLRIIAMSGGGRINATDFLRIAKAFGADRTFTKPFLSAELAAAIDELLPAA
jgi:CheY-like chemotaxis protein